MTTNAPNSNEQAIYQDLVGTEHLPPAAAYGILGNFQVESGFSPTAFNPAEGAIGIAQWEGGRRTNLDQTAAAMGQPETSLAAQLTYLNQELAGPFAGVLAQLRQPGISVQQAANVFDTQYEISTAASLPQREQDAAALAGGGNVNTGSGATLASAVSPLAGSSSLLGGLSDLLPWNWGSDIHGVVNTIIAFLLKMAFVGAGITLVVLGAFKASGTKPTDVAGLAAAAA